MHCNWPNNYSQRCCPVSTKQLFLFLNYVTTLTCAITMTNTDCPVSTKQLFLFLNYVTTLTCAITMTNTDCPVSTKQLFLFLNYVTTLTCAITMTDTDSKDILPSLILAMYVPGLPRHLDHALSLLLLAASMMSRPFKFYFLLLFTDIFIVCMHAHRTV